jgi:hypothetical protein
MPCGVGPKKLTLLQLADSTLQPLEPAMRMSTSTSMPSLHLRHVPDQVLPWPEVVEEACAFRDSLPATPALYDAYVPEEKYQPRDEAGTLLLLDGSLFRLINKVESVPGRAAMKFDDSPQGLDLPGKLVS